MTMSDLANWSQIFSSLAILVTLVYLSIEVKQNTVAINAQTRQALLAGSQVEIFSTLEHPEIIINWTKTGELTPEEYAKLHAYLVGMMRAREFAWLQYQNGIIDENQWQTEKGVIELLLTFKRNRVWWKKIGKIPFSPQFTTFVDALIEGKPDNDIGKLFLNWES